MEILNRKVSFDYNLLDKYEAGIKLNGFEVKSIRQGNCNLNDSYIIFNKDNRPIILNMYIGPYDYNTDNKTNISEYRRRSRELLLHKKEIIKLNQKVKLEGVTLIPTKLYFKDSLVKIEFRIAKGKNKQDKRQTIKERDLSRQSLLF